MTPTARGIGGQERAEHLDKLQEHPKRSGKRDRRWLRAGGNGDSLRRKIAIVSTARNDENSCELHQSLERDTAVPAKCRETKLCEHRAEIAGQTVDHVG